jgi:pilus assembly protein CpaB
MFFVNSGQKAVAPVIQALPPPPQLPTDEVLTAARELPMGTVIAETDVTWTVWPKSAVSPGMLRKSDTPGIIADLKGGVSRASFFMGEPIRREKIVKGPNAGFLSAMLPSGSRALAINIDAQGSTSAGGFVLPNDRVDILRTFREDEGGSGGAAGAYTTQTLLTNVRVLAIGQNVQEKNGQSVVVGSNATLEVDPRQAEIITLAQRTGQLSLVLRSMLDMNGGPSSPMQQEDEPNSKGMTIVRFGVAQQAKSR